MPHALPRQPVAKTGLAQQIDRGLFEHARAHPLDHVLLAPDFDRHRIDAGLLQEVPQEQPGRSGADDANRGSGVGHDAISLRDERPSVSRARQPATVTLSALQVDGEARASQAAHPGACHSHQSGGAAIWVPPGRRGRQRPHAAARWGSPGRAHHRGRPRRGRGRPARSACPGRSLAVQRRRPLPACPRQSSRADRPELQRRRARRHRRGRALPVRDHQAGGVSLGQSSECLAAGAHPLLALRRLDRVAHRHADVLSERPAVPVRSHLPVDPGRAGAPAARLALRPRF